VPSHYEPLRDDVVIDLHDWGGASARAELDPSGARVLVGDLGRLALFDAHDGSALAECSFSAPDAGSVQPARGRSTADQRVVCKVAWSLDGRFVAVTTAPDPHYLAGPTAVHAIDLRAPDAPLWTVSVADLTAPAPNDARGAIIALAWAPDGQRLAVATESKVATITLDGRVERTLSLRYESDLRAPAMRYAGASLRFDDDGLWFSVGATLHWISPTLRSLETARVAKGEGFVGPIARDAQGAPVLVVECPDALGSATVSRVVRLDGAQGELAARCSLPDSVCWLSADGAEAWVFDAKGGPGALVAYTTDGARVGPAPLNAERYRGCGYLERVSSDGRVALLHVRTLECAHALVVTVIARGRTTGA
jgi:hypothetical protein